MNSMYSFSKLMVCEQALNHGPVVEMPHASPCTQLFLVSGSIAGSLAGEYSCRRVFISLFNAAHAVQHARPADS